MTKAKKMSKYELNQYNAENNLILSILGPLIPNPQPPPVAEVAEPVDSSRGEKSSGDEAVDPAVAAGTEYKIIISRISYQSSSNLPKFIFSPSILPQFLFHLNI